MTVRLQLKPHPLGIKSFHYSYKELSKMHLQPGVDNDKESMLSTVSQPTQYKSRKAQVHIGLPQKVQWERNKASTWEK